MELEVYKKDGTKSGEKVKLSADIFGIEPNEHAMYRAVRVYLDNQRQGTSKVKTRAEVRGGGKKPFKQKHTGHGAPGVIAVAGHDVGGGSIFGPKPRDYSNTLPASMRKLARKSALSAKAQRRPDQDRGGFHVRRRRRPRRWCRVLKALELHASKTLHAASQERRECREVGTESSRSWTILEADKASTYDIVNNQMLLIQKSAVEVLQNTFKN